MSDAQARTVGRLLLRWDERVRRDLTRFEALSAPAAARGSVLRPPASEAEIAAAETRLGARLPPSYRAFLAVSNGADASSAGAVIARRGPPADHGFLRADEIGWARELVANRVDAWTDLGELMDPGNDHHFDDEALAEVRYFGRLRDAVLISRPMDNNHCDVLVPRTGAKDWELWSMHHTGAVAYASFQALLHWQIGRPNPAPSPERIEQFAAEARDGALGRIRMLALAGDPRVPELALRILLDDTLDPIQRVLDAGWVMQQLADRRFLPALNQALGEAGFPNARMQLLAALEACGEPEIDALLVRERASTDDDSLRSWVTRFIELRGR